LECEAPAGGFTNFDITDTDATPILTVDSGEQIQYIGAGTVTVVAAADASNHDVTITGSAHTTASGITMGGDVSGTADAAQVDDVQSATTNLEAADNNTTQVASTSFVQQEINGAGGTDLTCSAGQCNVDNPVTAATTASNLAADGVDALTEIAQGIKTAANDTDPLAVYTGGNPAGNVCVEMNSSGQLVTAGDTCANLGPGGTPTQILAGDSDVTVTDAGTGDVTVTVDSGAVGVWDAGGLTLGGTDVTDDLTLPTNNDVASPTLTWAGGSGFHETAANTLRFVANAQNRFTFSQTGFYGAESAAGRIQNEDATSTNPTLLPNKTDDDTGIGWAAADQLSLTAGAVEGLRLTEATTVSLQAPSYGDGSITGTATYWLAADTNGNIIEEAVPAAAGANSDITSITGLTTDLAVEHGGTGAGTFTDGGILIGNGTGAIQALGVATNGQIPIGDGTEDPVLAVISPTTNEIDVTNGAGTIQIGIVTSPTLDGSNFTGIAAGAYDADSIDSDDVAASLNTKSHCITIADPVTDEDWFTVWRAPTAVTLVEIYCEVTGGTSVAFDFQLDDGAPTAVNGSEITCTTSGVTDSTLGGSDVNMADGDRLDVLQGTVTGSVTQASYCIEYTID
jgi:hypothetical protein